jgi:DNA-binding MarR family transcriptional regulator
MSSRNFQQAAPRRDSRLVGSLLRVAWERVREQIYQGVRNDGFDDLNPAHVALFRYEGLDGQRPGQLAERMQITKQSINDLIRHLENCGYAETQQDPRDARARLISLTARGRRLEASVWKHARAAEDQLKEKIGAKRFATLLEILRAIQNDE